ncbi:MAG: MBL fold metallo-hydrolase [Anaerolineae bacterium]
MLRQLSRGCWVSHSRVFATNSAVFVNEGVAYLLDPGITPDELSSIAAFVVAQGAEVSGIVLSHAHWDHLLGASRFPDVPVIATEVYRKVVDRHARDLCRQVARWSAAEGLTAYDDFVPPEPDVAFSKRLTLRFGALELTIMAAPGHAPDQCVVYEPDAALLWAGDMLSDLEVPMVMDTFAAYLRTLRRLCALRIEILIPGHGTPTLDREEIYGRFGRDEAYLEEVYACVGKAVVEGASLEETVARCEWIPFAQPDSYPHAHAWNIEQAYREHGGPTEGLVGWDKDWV